MLRAAINKSYQISRNAKDNNFTDLFLSNHCTMSTQTTHILSLIRNISVLKTKSMSHDPHSRNLVHPYIVHTYNKWVLMCQRINAYINLNVFNSEFYYEQLKGAFFFQFGYWDALKKWEISIF